MRRLPTDGSYYRGGAAVSSFIAAFLFVLANTSCSGRPGWYPLPIDDHKYGIIDHGDALKRSAIPRDSLGPKLILQWREYSFESHSAEHKFDPLVKQLEPPLVEFLSEHGIESVKQDGLFGIPGISDFLQLDLDTDSNGQLSLGLELYRSAFPVWYPEDSLMVKVWWDQLSLGPAIGSIDAKSVQASLLQRVASLLSKKEGVGTASARMELESWEALQRFRQGAFLNWSPFEGYVNSLLTHRPFYFFRTRRFCIQELYGPIEIAKVNVRDLIATDLELLFRSYGDYPGCDALDQAAHFRRDAWARIDVGTASGSTPGSLVAKAKVEVRRTVRLTRVPINIDIVVWSSTQERDISRNADAERILRQVSIDAARELLKQYLQAKQGLR